MPYVMLTSREGLRPLYEGACRFTVVGQKNGSPLNTNGKSRINTVPHEVLHSA